MRALTWLLAVLVGAGVGFFVVPSITVSLHVLVSLFLAALAGVLGGLLLYVQSGRRREFYLTLVLAAGVAGSVGIPASLILSGDGTPILGVVMLGFSAGAFLCFYVAVDEHDV